MNYAQHFNPTQTPQSEQADPKQEKNNAGGHSFTLDPWKRLSRWLILGAEGGTYYVGERELTRDNAKTIAECLDLDGARTVEQIASVSEAGRAPKNDPAIFALALAASHKDPATRAAALRAVPRVCRIGTHLFHFAAAVDQFRGWGPGLRKAVERWYAERRDLAHEVTKYQQRDGWSHRDLLRLSHARPKSEHAAIFRWVATGADGMGERAVAGSDKAKRAERRYLGHELPAYLAAFEELKTADEKRTIALIREHGFTHEMIATNHKNSADVWAALLEKMPMTAMVRNLAKMTAVGLLKPMGGSVPGVCERLADTDALRKARVHPIAMLSALMVYRQGHGEKGKLSWAPVPQIIDALDAGFYASFGAIEPSGKRTLLALDVSGSMASGTIAGVPGLTPKVAAAAMAMVTARTEQQWHIIAFDHQLRFLPLTPRMRIDDVCRLTNDWGGGRTDCALPMLGARDTNLDVDTFVVLTDNETWAGVCHPHQALELYRQKTGIPAKLAVVGMTATEFTIANPADAGMLDVVGMDTATPNVLAEFSRGV
jgi:60 kDa SS-A/Ro ribonucleoprotein